MAEPAGPEAPGLSPHRLEALTDGIFAVAMTLLVIDLKLPERLAGAGDAELGHALLELLPKGLSWVVSFFVLAFFWVGHVRTFGHLKRVDGPLIALTLAQLAFASLMPFSSSLSGEHGGALVSQVVYSANMVALCVVALLVATRVARHPELVHAAPPPGRLAAARVRIVGLIVISLVAVAIAAVWPYGGNVAFVLMGAVSAASHRVERRVAARRDT